MWRAVAQLGSALDWGSRGRVFESRQPDHENSVLSRRKAAATSGVFSKRINRAFAHGRIEHLQKGQPFLKGTI